MLIYCVYKIWHVVVDKIGVNLNSVFKQLLNVDM